MPPILVEWENTYFNVKKHQVHVLPDGFMTVTGMGTPNATISWDYTSTPYAFQWLGVLDYDEEHPHGFGNFYQVTEDSWFTGTATITIDGLAPIVYVLPAGLNVVPDTGSTLALLGAALLVLVSLRH